jgi:hypothetical protein
MFGWFAETPDAGYSIATHVLLAIHVLFVNILLTNLLIAMFRYVSYCCELAYHLIELLACSKRFEQVYEDAQNIWHSQQYILTREYYSRAPLFPPFSIFYDIYRLIRMVFFRLRKACGKSVDRDKKVFSEFERMLVSQCSCSSSTRSEMIALEKEQVDEWGAFEGASTYEYAHIHAKEPGANTKV